MVKKISDNKLRKRTEDHYSELCNKLRSGEKLDRQDIINKILTYGCLRFEEGKRGINTLMLGEFA